MREALSKILSGILLAISLPVLADTTFTYQGQLTDGSGPYDGQVEMDFRLYDDETGGGAIDVLTEVVDVSGGLFQVELDFGDQPYDSGLWLQVSVGGDDLSPRQRITAAPLAIRALFSDVETYWSEISDGNISYNGGRVTVGPGLLARFGVNALHDETAMLVFSGGQAAFRVNENRSVSVGTNYSATGIPDQGLRVAGATILDNTLSVGGVVNLDDTLSVGGAAILEQGLHVNGNASVGGFGDDYRLGVGTENPWATLHVVSNDEQGPFRAMVGNNDTASTAIRAYGHGGVAIGNSWGDSLVPERGLRVSGEIHMRGNWSSTQSDSKVCAEVVSGPAYRLYACPNGDSSSQRYKEDIQPLRSASERIERMQAVSFRWKDSGEADIGLIAEDMVEIEPRLVFHNEHGEIEGIKYNHLTAVLIRAMQERRQQVDAGMAAVRESHATELAARDAEIAALRRELDDQRQSYGERLTALEALLLDGE